LTDPFLARLPACNAIRPAYWVPGHFYRHIPGGYLESVRDGNNQLHDERLRAYYDVIRLLTRGPIFSERRLAAIIGVALHRYEPLLEEYRKTELDPSQDDCGPAIAQSGGAFR
jgi:arabinofuranosyltransferase